MASPEALARIVPFAIYMGFIALADGMDRLGLDGQQRWLYGAKIGAVLLALWYFRRSYSELRAPWPRGRSLALSLACGVLVFVLWISLNAPWMQLGGGAGFDPRDNSVIQWPWVVLRWTGAALVVPVMEELFWRSFLLRWIEKPAFLSVNPAHVKYVSFVVIVVLFGFEHTLWLAGMVAAVGYNLVYMRSGNLWAAILAHAVTNGVLGVWVVATGQWSYW